jgi:hypothetical protein
MSPVSLPAGTPPFVPIITADDADRFLEASILLDKALEPAMAMAAAATTKEAPGAVHRHHPNQVDPHAVAATVQELARSNKDEFFSRFLEQTRHLLAESHQGAPSAASQQQIEAASCLFLVNFVNSKTPAAGSSLDVMRSKLQLMHQSLQRNWVKVIAVVLASIVACSSSSGTTSPSSGSGKGGTASVPGGSGSGDRIVIVEGKPSEEEVDQDRDHQNDGPHGDDHHQDPRFPRPNKRARHHQPHHHDDQGVQTCQSPSFDSSLATLRDEDEHSRGHLSSSFHPPDLNKIASFVVGKAAEASRMSSPDLLTADAWMDWYRSGDGAKVASWLELLELGGWKKHASSSSLSPGSLSSELPHQPQKQQAQPSPPGPIMVTPSPTLISFDFSTNDSGGRSSSLLIDISEENLLVLREFASTTELWHRPASDMCRVLMGASKRRPHDGAILIHRADFIRAVVEKFVLLGASRSSDLVHNVLNDFFSLYELPTAGFSSASSSGKFSGCADLKELAVGMCFFCAGTKSVKLATAFELLDERQQGYLTDQQLFGYLRSYLLALVALSLLVKSGNQKPMTSERLSGIWTAVESGARWTLSHFACSGGNASDLTGRFTFESFAGWYSSGGYKIAPWLELLDLSKTLALIQHDSSTANPSTMTPLPLPAYPPHPSTVATAPMTMSGSSRNRTDRISSLRRRHSMRNCGIPPEILFSFPLAANRFLVVLKEDASYVREVVETLGLLASTPDDLWTALSRCVGKRQRPPAKDEPTVYVNEGTFLDCMNDASVVGHAAIRKRAAPGFSGQTSRDELLRNFFLCFDVGQCDRVALDELMGGLALLCGGKKSMKLSFAFTIFDTRPELRRKKRDPTIMNSLSGEDLFLFLRSVLIVMFSCCRQSIDMTDAEVSQCISDTANMICNDVMRHQWETKQANRCNFDEFGQWYNDGGFERAPWLELLDLKKWVLVDNIPPAPKLPSHPPTPHPPTPKGSDIPPPPPEDELDASFFEDNGIMPMDSVRYRHRMRKASDILKDLRLIRSSHPLLCYRWTKWI